MKRAGFFTVLAVGALMAAGIAGCQRQEVASLPNPQLDGVTPRPRAVPDMSILKDQRTLHDKFIESAGPVAKPAAATPPSTHPAAPASDANSPITPP